MNTQKKIQVQNLNNAAVEAQTVEVLYQKMGDRWYAFSLVNDDVFVGSITEDEIATAENNGLEKFIEVAEQNPHDSPEAA